MHTWAGKQDRSEPGIGYDHGEPVLRGNHDVVAEGGVPHWAGHRIPLNLPPPVRVGIQVQVSWGALWAPAVQADSHTPNLHAHDAHAQGSTLSSAFHPPSSLWPPPGKVTGEGLLHSICRAWHLPLMAPNGCMRLQ